jgi:hypothetical protein
MEKIRHDGAIEGGLEERVAAAANFDELYAVLDAERTILGSSSTYSALTLKQAINDIREKARDNDLGGIGSLTRSGGLRNKVIELLLVEANDERRAALEKLKS